MSGLASCVQPQTYSGPDSATAAVSGSCSDQAGNVRNASFGLKYDATAPPDDRDARLVPPDANGWYNRAHSGQLHWRRCNFRRRQRATRPRPTRGPTPRRPPGQRLVPRQRREQRRGAPSRSKYDATAPQVTAAPSRPANGAGWYSAPLTVSFSGGDATSGRRLVRCHEELLRPGQRHGRGRRHLPRPGRERRQRVVRAQVRRDGPVTDRGARRAQPNANGWFNAPLTVSFAGHGRNLAARLLRRRQGLLRARHRGAPVSGICRDKAGNSARRRTRSSTTRRRRRRRRQPPASRTQPAGTPRRSRSASPPQTRLRRSTRAMRRRAIRVLTSARPRSPAPAATRPATRPRPVSLSSTTPPPRQRRPRRPGSRTPPAGTGPR